MRMERRQLKERRRISIPDELVAFLAEVDRLITSRDEAATTESDDLLQCEGAYGGLCEEGGDRYAFTYFPEHEIRHKWMFELSAGDIAAIGRHVRHELQLWFCTSAECRSAFQSRDALCFYCDYVDEETG